MIAEGANSGPPYRPLLPENMDQGDPYLFAAPVDVGRGYRYYAYVTGEDIVSGRAFPFYGSNDLLAWERLGEALETDHYGSHWAPCVSHVPGLERPFVMLYSRAIGVGAQGHIGHTIRRADAATLAGPFRDSGHVLTEDFDFAIDPDVYRLPNGSLKIAFAIDFVEDEPYGTGIVEADISDDLTALRSAPRVLARPKHDWHVYDAARVMPWKFMPGVDWTQQTVKWHTVEAPVGGLATPNGDPAYLYSGGCFFGFYAVGSLRETEHGLQDLTDGERNFVVRPEPERGFYGPGHCSWLRLDNGDEVLMMHARFGSPNAKRQMCLARLRWTSEGIPYAEPAS